MHLLEVHKTYLIAVSIRNEYRVFCKLSKQDNHLGHSGTSYQQCSLLRDIPSQQTTFASQAELISIVQLKQFANTRKSWFVSINFCYQVSLLEFQFNPLISKESPSKVTLKRLQFQSIENDDLQPFCLTELCNTRSATGETFGDLIIGCAMGTLLVYELKSQVKQIAVIGGISVIDNPTNKASQS